ncbi:hypothetical protein EPH95_03945 [Salicibibacter halophilus]|uniref:RNA polymerase sigma-70 region 2 domain-containing protein n=1 Tax=Salicibibacter halophilus TaxID=2502791 RepID=A0A514LF02_9BACI|nr:hypothetical protein EPH95_03945 [Salicibibacter halophilus]
MLKRLHIHSNHYDFVQAGYLGLWLAYHHHDSEKGPFSSYAFVRVRGEMSDDAEKGCQLLRPAFFQFHSSGACSNGHRHRCLDIRCRKLSTIFENAIRTRTTLGH